MFLIICIQRLYNDAEGFDDKVPLYVMSFNNSLTKTNENFLYAKGQLARVEN